jgi:hypothetical protein
MLCNFTLIVYHMSCTAQDWGNRAVHTHGRATGSRSPQSEG